MPRPIQALIHADALTHNLQQVRRRVGAAQVWAVVKANAYGHGIARVFPVLSAADGFAVLDINEAVLLRELGWEKPILLLEGVFSPQDLETCAAYDLWHTVHSAQQLTWLMQTPGAYRHGVYLKLNGGMHRLGFTPQVFPQVYAQLRAQANVAHITLMMHFSGADAMPGAHDPTAQQLATFHQATQQMPGARSLSNSAAILRYGQTLPQTWVRAGIMLYGSAPDYPQHRASDWDLQATMTLRGRLLATQFLKPGDTVGYGATFTANTAMRIGVVSCGYADGYPRQAPTGSPVLVDGVKTRIVGRVSMDMLTVDLTPTPQADCGSEVTLWGHASAGTLLPIDAVAHACGTVAYELMCALAPRVPVRVV